MQNETEGFLHLGRKPEPGKCGVVLTLGGHVVVVKLTRKGLAIKAPQSVGILREELLERRKAG